jgi:3,4-dihydroxy 2-butanone 4-phosphate synthase/GTP cyclohydrolase II
MSDATRASGAGQPFAQIPDILDALRRGEWVVIVDDEKRENEGDLVVAAEKATPEAINFMARHGRGLICVAMDRAILGRFGLARMITHADGPRFKTAFMESVDARHGISTGISAYDRARTIHVLLDEHSGPADLVRPGHTFPLEAVEGGVLRRPGHTEAAVDLARMAGLKPAGVICEILKDDGQMARLPDLLAFAAAHQLRIATVADLVAYRRRNEKLVELERTVQLPTEHGVFQLHMYGSRLDGHHHVALVMGQPAGQPAPLVRIHSECLTGDVFASQRCDCGSQLRDSMARIAAEGHGAVIYMRQEGRGIGLANKIHAYELQESGLDTVQANEELGFEADLRDYGISAQILLDLGLRRVRLLTNNPMKIQGLQRYGVEVVERLPIVQPVTSHNVRYLEAKKAKLGHLL